MCNRQIDMGLRLGGTMLCALSWLAFQGLERLHLSAIHGPPGVAAFILAAAVLCASPGAVLLLLGHHIFDPVEISARWSEGPWRPDQGLRFQPPPIAR